MTRQTEREAAPGEARRSVSLPLSNLPPRQAQVAELILAGASRKEISQHLGITIMGVKFHIAQLYRKLGLYGNADHNQLVSLLRTGIFNHLSSIDG